MASLLKLRFSRVPPQCHVNHWALRNKWPRIALKWSLKKSISLLRPLGRLREPTVARLGFFPNMEQGWVWPGAQHSFQFCVADELPLSFCLSLRAARRVSAGLLWLWCKPSGSPCSVERSPARPRRSGLGRWKGSSRVRVWRHTGAESWSRPGCSGGCSRWTARTSGETRGWRWPWSRPLLSSRPPQLTWCCLAPLQIRRIFRLTLKLISRIIIQCTF